MLSLLNKIFFPNKEKSQIQLIQLNSISYINILIDIKSMLNPYDHKGQLDFIENLLSQLKTNNFEEFHKNILSGEMWGGSGAVWEVCIFDNEKMRKFQILIIELIDLMEVSLIKKWYIHSIKKLFLSINKNDDIIG